KAEEGFRQALLGSQGGLGIFWSNWLVGSIMTLGMVLLFWPMIAWAMGKLRAGLAGGTTVAGEQSSQKAQTSH
ncbi:MAG TPA: hypothetical protein VH858_13405, partial [Hyphomicrobiales bacterium]